MEKAGEELITIRINDLKGFSHNLASFLKERIGVEASVQDDKIMLNKGSRSGLTARRLKVYLKRFLYLQGLRRKYRILVKGSEMNFVKVK